MPKKVNKEENKAKREKKHYFKDFKAELKKVIWPTPKQLINNTITVMVMVLITAVIVFALDLIFETGNKYGLEKLKSVVSNNTTNNTVGENTTVDNTIVDNTTSEENNPENSTEPETPEESTQPEPVEE